MASKGAETAAVTGGARLDESQSSAAAKLSQYESWKVAAALSEARSRTKDKSFESKLKEARIRLSPSKQADVSVDPKETIETPSKTEDVVITNAQYINDLLYQLIDMAMSYYKYVLLYEPPDVMPSCCLIIHSSSMKNMFPRVMSRVAVDGAEQPSTLMNSLNEFHNPVLEDAYLHYRMVCTMYIGIHV